MVKKTLCFIQFVLLKRGDPFGIPSSSKMANFTYYNYKYIDNCFFSRNK